MMTRFRLALLASCVAFPAYAQEIAAAPKDDPNTANANARATAMAAQGGRSTANADATASSGGQQAGNAAVPRSMPPPVIMVSPDKPLNHKEAVGVQVAQRWISKFQKPHLDESGVLHFVAGKGQVMIVTAVDHITDVSLAPGETIFPPLHVGADGLWHVHPATSRVAGKLIMHILIKPTDAGLSSNVVIETNKRTISLSLTSRQSDYMPLVAIDAPEDEDADMTAYASRLEATASGQPASACDQSPMVPPDQYSIPNEKFPWRPVQVYQVATPVGIKTCVDFPSDIGSGSLPALLALADDGGWFSGATRTVVNVRFVNRRFIVDEALNRFVLVDGVGGDQKVIKITRKGM